MKRLLLLVWLFFVAHLLIANPVDKETARKVAVNFLSQLTKTKVEFNNTYEITAAGRTGVYVFASDKGFVIVSADDNVKPVLGYSTDSPFRFPIENEPLKWWLEGYANQIVSATKEADPQVKKQWEELINGTFKLDNPSKATYLLTTTWDQMGGDDQYPYNYFCPAGTPVGCVATATAQVMKYWEYPAQGRGWHSYVHDNYGRLYAIYDTTHYDWNSMPDNGSSYYVALLSYHLGVAVDMDYDPAGSGSFTFSLTYVLPNYFRYSNDIMYYSRSYIETLGGTQAWKDSLINQINLGRPVIYAGYDQSMGGHAFVCDGYDPATDMFHFNWGWSGSGNGWYTIDNLNPLNYAFNNSQSIVINIYPDTNNTQFYMTTTSGIKDLSTVRFINAPSNNVAYAVGNNYGGIAKTEDGGGLWDLMKFPSDYSNYQASMAYAVNEDTVYVPVFGSGTFLLKSEDGGKTWTKILSGADAQNSFFNVVHFFDENRGVVQGDPVNGDFEIYVTNDGGQTWTRVDGANIPDALPGEYGIVGYYYANSNIIWYFTNKGRVFRSLDYGLHWDVKELITPNSFGDPDNNDATSIAGAISDQGYGVLYELYVEYTATDTTFHHYYFYTEDAGDTWTQYTPQGDIGSVEQMRVNENNGILVSVGDYVSYSVDSGKTWIKMVPDYYDLFYFTAFDASPDFSQPFFGSPRTTSFGGNLWGVYNHNVTPNFKVSADRACVNSTVVFTDQSIGETYQFDWDFGDGASPRTAAGPGPHQVTYATAGEKTVILTVSNSQGEVFTKQLTYKVDGTLPDPVDQITGETLPVLNQTYTYTVPEQDAHFSWKLPDGWRFVGIADTNAVNVKVGGSLGQQVVSVKPYNGCGNGTGAQLIVTVINNVQNAYPNPSSDYVYIEDALGADVTVVDSKGQVVDRFVSQDYVIRLNVADGRYTNGVYNVVLKKEDGTKRVVRILVIKQ